MSQKLDANLFITDSLFTKEVELFDGTKKDFNFVQLPYSEWRHHWLLESVDDEDKKKRSVSRIISLSLVDDDGKKILTEDEADRLKPNVANSFYRAILSISNSNGDEGKQIPS